jgi:hypothetical protein
MVSSIISECVGAEKAFGKLVGTFPQDFQSVWDSRHTTEKLLNLASKLGCAELINSAAKGALKNGVPLHQMSFEKTLDLLGGIDITVKIDGKIIGIDVTLDEETYIEKRSKLLFRWNEGRKKVLKALRYHHVIVVVWKVDSWSELTQSQKGELAEQILIHLEEQDGKSYCSKLVLE